MSHLTTSANTPTDAGAPGATGTSPGQDIGTDEVQDQSNTHKEPKHSHDHADKSAKTKTHHEEKHSERDSRGRLDAPTKVTARTPTPSGAPGATGASPMEPYGGDESRDDSPKVHDHHKHHNHSKKEKSHSEEKESSSTSKSSTDSKPSGDGETNPGVTASTKTSAGAVGPTGTGPMEPIGSDESRDDSPKVHDHHKHHDHSKKKESQSSEKESSISKPATKNQSSEDSKSSTKTTSSGDGETNPGVTASTKTPAGAVGPTGTGPMEPVGSDESRDDSPKVHTHHKHDSHHSAETKSSAAKNEGTPITKSKPIPDGTDSSKQSSKDESDGTPITKSKAIPLGKDTTSSGKSSSTTEKSSTTTKKSDGEFDGPNASFTSEIGSKEDPGRVAEEKMYEQNAQHGDVGSMGVKQNSITGGGQFDALKSEEAA